jgi:hypothetical protein
LVVEAAAAKKLTATFAGADATLSLGAASRFAATIAEFAVGDVIDLMNTTATAATLEDGDELLVTDGATTVATLQLSGDYAGDTFATMSDGSGGTAITLNRAQSPATAGPGLFSQLMATLQSRAGFPASEFPAPYTRPNQFAALTHPAIA